MITYSTAKDYVSKDELLKDLDLADNVVAALPSGERSTLWTRGILPSPFRTLCVHVADASELRELEALVATNKFSPGPEQAPDTDAHGIRRDGSLLREHAEHEISVCDALSVKLVNAPDLPPLRVFTSPRPTGKGELILGARSERDLLQLCAMVYRLRVEGK